MDIDHSLSTRTAKKHLCFPLPETGIRLACFFADRAVAVAFQEQEESIMKLIGVLSLPIMATLVISCGSPNPDSSVNVVGGRSGTVTLKTVKCSVSRNILVYPRANTSSPREELAMVGKGASVDKYLLTGNGAGANAGWEKIRYKAKGKIQDGYVADIPALECEETK